MVYRNRLLCGAALCLMLTSAAEAQPLPVITPKSNPPFPTQAVVEKAVTDYLAQIPGREENDLISRGDVEPLFPILEKLGWEVSDEKEILERILADSDWMVRTLRTKKGKVFMRDMSGYPEGYDRVDRMRNETYGKRELVGLINTPHGAKLIEYLTTSKQGLQTGSQIKGKDGGVLNEPTNRLYKKADVFKQLQTSYAAEVERRMKGTSTSGVTPAVSSLQPEGEKGRRKRGSGSILFRG